MARVTVPVSMAGGDLAPIEECLATVTSGLATVVSDLGTVESDLGTVESGLATVVDDKLEQGGELAAPWELSQYVRTASGNSGVDSLRVRWDDNLDLVADRERPLGTLQKTWKVAEQINSDLTVTVKTSSGDFTTIQSAWDYFKNKVIKANITIAPDAGSWNEAGLVLGFNPYGSLITITGDTRTAAGKVYAATGNITKSGNNCTITLTESVATDFGAGDYVTICGAFTTAANVGRFPIVSVSGSTITYTNASGVAEATLVGYAILNPNRIITRTTAGNPIHKGASCNLSGVTILNTGGGSGVCIRFSLSDPGMLNLTKTHVYGSPASGILTQKATLGLTTTTSIVKCAYEGVYASAGSMVLGYGSFSANNLAGYACANQSRMYVDTARAIGNTFGYRCLEQSYMYAITATAKYNATNGYYAEKCSYINASSTVANCSNNGANFSPASSDTVGNVGSYITFS